MAACGSTGSGPASGGAAGSHAATGSPAPGHTGGSGRTPAQRAQPGGGTSASSNARGTGQADAAGGNTPAGFWNGTDSFAMPVTGTGPYREPVIGGSYGGYIGMTGNWAHWQGCGGGLVWSAANARQAAANLATYHKGIGTSVYWFMAGPGVDPNYDGTVAEAVAWGQQQAARALGNIGSARYYPVVWM